jgi:hypothetical protein
MSKEQLLKILKDCQDGRDTEMAHGDADRALLEFIADPEITEAYKQIERWYA